MSSKDTVKRLAQQFTVISALLLVTGSLVVPASSQQTPNISEDTAIANYGTDRLNLQTLTPLISAPIRVKGGLTVSIDLGSSCTVANNKWVCGVQNVGGPKAGYLPTAQIQGLLAYGLSAYNGGTSLCPSNGQYYGTLYFSLVDRSYNRLNSFGGGYGLGIITNCPNQSNSGTTTDGSALTLNLNTDASGNLTASFVDKFGNTTNSIAANAGPIYYYPSSVSDPFGNTFSGTLTTSVTEPIKPSDPALIETAQNSQLIPTAWKYHDTSGTVYQNVTLSTGSITLSSSLGCAATEESGTRNVINSINYPDLTSESFTYYSDGRLKTITLRTGGIITYTYGAMDCTFYIPTSITRQTADGTWTYAMAYSSQFSNTTTTVLDPGKNKTVYSFADLNAPRAPVLTEVQVSQNVGTVSAPSYSLLTTDVVCYNGNTSSCGSGSYVYYPITEKAVTHTIGNMTSSSQTVTFYDGGPSGGCAHATSPCYHNVTEIDHYDIGQSTPTMKEITSYGSWNGTGCVYVGNNIYGKQCEVTTVDNASHTIGDTRYTYNSHGALTTTARSTGSQWLTTTSVPNSNGTAQSITNERGLLTSYGYSGGCNGLLPTSTSSTVNGVLISSSQTWDCNGAVVLTTTDENGHTPPATQYDAMFRPILITDNSGYQTSITYTANSVSTSASSGGSVHNHTAYSDGLGRSIITQTQQGPSSSNYDTQSFTYSFNGPNWQVKQSAPCTQTSDQPCSQYTTSLLDPTGRLISVTDPMGGVENYSYNQNDVSVSLGPPPAGEHVKTVQAQTDGLGRVQSVCALETTGGSGCTGQAMGGSGILTSYSYSYGPGTSTVVTNRGSQSHTVIKDGLGRTTSVQTPEGGTVTYVFDSYPPGACSRTSQPGDLMLMWDPSGNNVCQVHDQLHRLTDFGGTEIPAVCNRLRYDTVSTGLLSPPPDYPASGTNIVGRLVEAETDTCGWPVTAASQYTDEWFAYDSNGRLTDLWEKTPNSGGGFYHTTVTRFQDGSIASLSGIPGYSAIVYSYDGEGRPNAAAGSTTFINSVTYDASGRPRTVNIGAGDSDIYTYDANENMKTYSFSVNGITDSGTLQWNQDGTLQQLAILDGFNSGGSQTCTFSYDDVARLMTDNCGSSLWNQSYSYDQYDNLSKTGNPGTSWSPGYLPNNQITGGANYNGDGDLTYDFHNTYTWNAAQKMMSANPGTSAASCGTSGTCLIYDALGRVVEKNVAGTYIEILYTPLGETAMLYGASNVVKARVPMPGGSAVWTTGPGGTTTVNYDHADWLGTVRLETDLVARTPTFDTAYTPYGELYDSFGTVKPDFTGDFQVNFAGQININGLYDTPNREFDPGAGSRWLSPDPAGASWNAYEYTTNPNSIVDPSGLLGIGGNALIRQYLLEAQEDQDCETLSGWSCTESPTDLYSDWLSMNGPGSFWRLFPQNPQVSGSQIFGGQDCLGCWSLGPSPLDIVQQVLSGNLAGALQNAGIVPMNGVDCTSGVCVVNPIMDADSANNQPTTQTKLKNAANCVTTSLPGLMKDNTTTLGGDLKTSLTAGVAFGVGTCTTIVAFEPYLAPAWLPCSGVASAGLVNSFGGLSVTKWFVGNMAATVGSVYFCAKNEVF
jgi:YD repeat-containing protein